MEVITKANAPNRNECSQISDHEFNGEEHVQDVKSLSGKPWFSLTVDLYFLFLPTLFLVLSTPLLRLSLSWRAYKCQGSRRQFSRPAPSFSRVLLGRHSHTRHRGLFLDFDPLVNISQTHSKCKWTLRLFWAECWRSTSLLDGDGCAAQSAESGSSITLMLTLKWKYNLPLFYARTCSTWFLNKFFFNPTEV